MTATEKAEELLAYVKAHPEQRFWQALRNWSGHTFIWVSNELDRSDVVDTFYAKD